MKWETIYWFFIKNLYDFDFFRTIFSDLSRNKQINIPLLCLFVAGYSIIILFLFFKKTRQYLGKYILILAAMFFCTSIIWLGFELLHFRLKNFSIEIYTILILPLFIPLAWLIIVQRVKHKIVRWSLIACFYPIIIWVLELFTLTYFISNFWKLEILKTEVLHENLKIKICEDWYPNYSFQLTENKLGGIIEKEYSFNLPGVDNRSVNDSLKLIEFKNDSATIVFYQLSGHKPDMFNDTCIYVDGKLFLKEYSGGKFKYSFIKSDLIWSEF